MPLIIEWSSSENNPVSELLNVMLAQGTQTAEAGMKINQNVMTFTELLNYYYRDASQGDKYAVPTYGMFNLASNFQPAYDQSYEWTLDPEMIAQGYNLNRLYNEAMDALTMNMVLRRGFQQHAAVHDLLEGLPDAVERAAPADPALLQHLHHRLSGLA